MSSETNADNQKDHSPPEHAVLIVGGTRAVPLEDSVITIGRHHDNMVVVDDPRVSRHHVQLRAIHGRYVLFDLGSSGGTFLNGQRTSQAVLYPGDIISLAGVDIHFINEVMVRRRGWGDTSVLYPGLGERATAILRTWFLNKKK